MIAKIKNKNKIYDSVVFAFSCKSLKSKVIVFDETYTKLIVLNCSWKSKTEVLFTSFDCENYRINEDSFKSYWNNKKIFNLVDKEKYGEDILSEAKELQSKIEQKEWYEINNFYELQGLVFTVGHFHDACVIKINEKEQYTEVLIDTTWGLYVLFRCYYVIDNTLDLNYCIQDCKYSYKDGIIEILFDDEFVGSYKLKCKKIEYKYYFERKYALETYCLENNTIEINNKSDETKIDFNLIDTIIFSTEEITNIGMMKYFDYLSTYTFAQGDYFIVLQIYPKHNEHISDFKVRFEKLRDELGEKGLYFYNVFEECVLQNAVKSFGNVIFKEEQSSFSYFFYSLKYICIPSIGNVLFWLIVQLCNPKMKWIVFYIFGLVISFIYALLVFVIELIQYSRVKKSIIIYENGIVCNGDIYISVAYFDIIDVKKRKRIILVTKNGDFKLLRSKNDDKIFELIKQKVDETKEK